MKNARLQLNRCIGFLLAAIMLAGLVPCSLITAEADTSYTSNVIGPLQIEEDFGEPDPSVDLETEADFEASLNNLVLKGMPYNERVLAVAMTQLGNHESETNFIVKEDEATHEKAKYGITRYGQWYGLPYEDWCAMFISFCLHYAEVPSELMPIDSGVITTMHKLQQAELYCSRGEDYQPKPGDLIFFDFDFDGQGDHVGLVADLTWEDDAEVVKTIEGNHTTTVEYFAYNCLDPAIMGYGVMSTEIPAEEQEGQLVTDFLSEDGNTYRVTMTYAADAQMPDGAEIRVAEILPGTEAYDAYIAETEGALGWEEGATTEAKVFDISIFSDGEEIQPQAPVNVEFVLLDQRAEDWNVVHFGEDAPQVLESTFEGDALTFETEGFSVFVFAKAVLEKKLTASDHNTYKITVTYDSSAGIPEGAQLDVSEIMEGSREYAEYVSKSENAVGVEEGGSAFVRLFDIKILDENGNKVEITAPVDVKIELAGMGSEENISDTATQVVHFADGEETGSVVENVSVTPPEEAKEDVELSFETSGFSVFAVVGTVIEKTVLASDGRNYHITVTFKADSGIPADADLAVEEIFGDSDLYDAYVSRSENALGLEEGTSGYLRLFDISIVDQDGEKIQPAEGSSVTVRIELANSESSNLSVVHFADETVEGEVVETTIESSDEGQIVSFETNGFSVYAIVDAPEPASFDPYDLGSVSEIEESKAYLLSYGSPKKYFTSDLNNKGCLIENTDAYYAAEWYFEAVSGEENTYYIYTLISGEKKYIHQKSGNEIELADTGTPIVLSETSTSKKFFFKHGSETRYLQHSNGGGGIRFYTDCNDVTNARIYITDAASMVPADDPYGLDGKSFGIAYHDESVTAAALTATAKTSGDQQRLEGTDLVIRPDVLDNEGYLLVSEDSDITEWTFVCVQQDQYYLTVDVEGTTQYLVVDGSSIYLADEPDSEKSVITAKPGTGSNAGKWHFLVGNYALNLQGNSMDGFNAATGSGATTWLNLVEKSVLTEEDFTLYTAQKVSVSDTVNVYDGREVVIYTRVWNDTTKKYEFYAVDYDGSLVRCYDTGNSIEWVGTKVNTALWKFTEYTNPDGTVNYYYELQNTQYGNYIAPQVSGGQTISDSTIGINLNGRRYGENYTTIIAWDDANYQYVGLKVDGGKVVACPLSEAEDFYFAIMDPREDRPLTEVDTVDSNAFGITMKMVDFNNEKTSSDVKAGRDKVQTEFFGTKDNNTAGLLTTNLSDGYPTTTDKTGHEVPLSDLFIGMQDVNHLFIQSIYNESGYFEYDSTQNSALLGEDGNFTVYDQLLAVGTETGGTRTHGQFLPYNEIPESRIYASEANNNPAYTNQTDVTGKELSDLDPRKGEELYWISFEEADYFFGMELSTSFTQTPSGLDAWGHDIIFEFSGDDDFWLYVDGELILDLGGVHSAMTGTVNFRTGVVTSSRGNSTLFEIFKKNYQTRGLTEEEINAKLDEIFTRNENGQYVFKDYTNHDMKIFYMERGAGASNLHMRFNLAAVKPGTFLLSKKLSGTELEDSSLIEFPYQIYYYTTADGESTPHLLGEVSGEEDMVVYEGTSRTLNSAGKYSSSFKPAQGTKAYEHVFFLKPGETAEVTLPDGAVSYYVVECGVNPDIYDEVRANSTLLGGTVTENSINGTERKDYATSKDTLDNRSKVEYDNHVSENAMRTLSITKRLYDADGSTELIYPNPETTFTFRLYLGDENANASALPLANLYPYYIKDVSGNYCYWDASSLEFLSLGVTTYDELTQLFENENWTDAQKESVIFKTSMNGSISKIPAGYTVEVRNLVISTQYKVEERDYEIPKGYTRRDADGYTRVDTDPYNRQSTPYTGTIAKEEDPKIEVRNQKGWGLTVEKVWMDKDFMESHDDIYFAVYLNNPKDSIADNDTLINGTVRCLKNSETEIYYFFDDLRAGTENTTYTFDQFVVREVTLTKGSAFQVDSETGIVTGYETITPIYNNGTLNIGGQAIGGEHHEAGDNGFRYTVTYEVGDSTGRNENIRTDMVTNSRPGIKLYKSNWTGAWNEGTLTGALDGAKFTLKDSVGNDVAASSYTSGSDGLITIAYLNAGTYTLTETETPNGYVRLDSPITITVDNSGSVSVSGVDNRYYILDSESDSSMSAVITIKNRTTELLAKKVDEKKPETVLENVHFALYRQVTDSVGNPRKDYQPITGYEDLVTDENGIIPNITMDLGAGTYYLTETQTISGYALLTEDICFTIGKDGTVTLNNGADTGSAISRTEDASIGKTTYVLTIPNYELGVKLKKVDDHSKALTGAKFSLYIKNEPSSWESVAGYSDIDMNSTSVTTLSNLIDGLYKLTETTAPAGYILPAENIFFKVENGAVILTKEDGITPADNTTVSVSTEPDQNKNTVYVITITNTPGIVLPKTGGIGTELITAVGGMITIGTGTLLLRRRKKKGKEESR